VSGDAVGKVVGAQSPLAGPPSIFAWEKPVVMPRDGEGIEVVDVVVMVLAVDFVVVLVVVLAIGRDDPVPESIVDVVFEVDVWGPRRLRGGNACRGVVGRCGCLECAMSALDTAASAKAPCRGTPSAREVIAASFGAMEPASEFPGAATG
jgi:hypothetical protein